MSCSDTPTIGSTWRNCYTGTLVTITAIDGDVIVCDLPSVQRWALDLWRTHWEPDPASDPASALDRWRTN